MPDLSSLFGPGSPVQGASDLFSGAGDISGLGLGGGSAGGGILSSLGGLLGGGSGGGISDLLGGIIGGGSNIAAGQANKQAQQDQLNWIQDQWNRAAQYNRPSSQTTPFGSMQWTQDDKGNWSQTSSLNQADQARLDQFRNLASARMANAAQMTPQGYKPIDYNAMGLGALASAAGVQPGGTTGARPWATSPSSSVAGEWLNTMANPMLPYGGVAQAGNGYKPQNVAQPNSFQKGNSLGSMSDQELAILANRYYNPFDSTSSSSRTSSRSSSSSSG